MSAIALLFCICFASAQTTAPATAKKPKTTATTTKPATTATTAKPAAGPTKKDGTPDMRYKANKQAAAPAGPTKKDGTPDMRYKANKQAAAAKPAATAKPKGN